MLYFPLRGNPLWKGSSTKREILFSETPGPFTGGAQGPASPEVPTAETPTRTLQVDLIRGGMKLRESSICCGYPNKKPPIFDWHRLFGISRYLEKLQISGLFGIGSCISCFVEPGKVQPLWFIRHPSSVASFQ